MIVRYGTKRPIKWVVASLLILSTILKSCAGSAAARSVLGVVTPGPLGLGETTTIRWSYDDGNGGPRGRFDIDLYQCSDAFCGQSDCGEFVVNICDKPRIGCTASDGDYVMEVPTSLTPADGYKIRVGLHGTQLFDCTSTFSIIQDIPVSTLEVFAPALVSADDLQVGNGYGDDDSASVVLDTSSSTGSQSLFRALRSSNSPSFDAYSETGIEGNDIIYVRWEYNDGMGGSFARFNIDLYYCGGGCERNENCGQAVARLCEGCPDSSGEERVPLPFPYSSHNYKIRVSTYKSVQRSVSACSPKFEITAREHPEYSTPTPVEPGLYIKRQPDPRTRGTPDPVADLPSTPIVRPTNYPAWGPAHNPPAKGTCGNLGLPDIRYASTTKRVYVERNGTRGGCVTLSDIWELEKGALHPINPRTNKRARAPTGVWLLTEELYVSDGVTLQVHGTARGGDCDELRLLSDENTFINLRAHGGILSFLGTKVISWDEGKGTVDTHHEDGRSYVSAVSEVKYDPSQTCDGNAKEDKGESRMDVIDSEIGYLGFHESESYGLVWKVRGFCVDKSNLEVFDSVNVYGDIINSDIHHNYFGMYSYGHQDGNWSYNKMHDNVEYGFDPHDDSDYLIIHGNDVWGNGNHGIIASKRCDHVQITDNHVYDGFNTGIFLHRSSDFAIVSGNHVHDNGDAGLAVLESFYLNVKNNVFKNNRYGIRFSVGAGYNWIHDNIVDSSTRYNIFTYLGSDPPDVEGTSGLPIGNVFWRNYISGTRYDTIKLKQAESSVIVNNRIRGASTVSFDGSSDTMYRDNEEETGMEGVAKGSACFSDDSSLTPKC